MSAAALVLLLHAAVIALVMLSRSPKSAIEKPGLTAFDIANDGDHQSQRQTRPHRAQTVVPVPALAPPIHLAIIDPVQSLPQISPIADLSLVGAPVAIEGGCDLTQPVQQALRQSDDVRRLLPAIPADRRSVANAVVVWNAGWIEAGAAPAQAAFATIRQAVTQVVTAASAVCRSQLQRGPRLLYVPGATGKTMVLGLGSGQWTWQQLIDGQPVPATVAQAGPVPPASVRFAMPQPVPAAEGQTPAVDTLLASLVHKQSPTATP